MNRQRCELLQAIADDLQTRISPELGSADAKHRAEFARSFLQHIVSEAAEEEALGHSSGPDLLGASRDMLGFLEEWVPGLELDGYRRAVAALASVAADPDVEQVAALRGLLARLTELAVDAEVADAGAHERRQAALEASGRADARWTRAIGEIQRAPRPTPGKADAVDSEGSAGEPTAEALTAYLRRRFPSSPELECTEASILPGGFSKSTIFVSLTGTDKLPAEVVMRQDARLDYLEIGTSVRDEHSVLAFVSERDPIAPRPVLLESAATELGPPFILTERLPGTGAGRYNHWNDPGPEVAADVARFLGKLHSIDVGEVALPGGGGDLTQEQRFVEQIEASREKWHRTTVEPSPMVEYAFNWLESEGLRTGIGGPSVVHGDAAPHNMLTENGRLTGLTDWELVHVGDPAEDVAYCRPAIEQLIAWDEFLALYHDAGGPPVDERRLRLWTVWTALRNAAFCATCSRTFRNGVGGMPLGAIGFISLRECEALLGDLLEAAPQPEAVA